MRPPRLRYLVDCDSRAANKAPHRRPLNIGKTCSILALLVRANFRRSYVFIVWRQLLGCVQCNHGTLQRLKVCCSTWDRRSLVLYYRAGSRDDKAKIVVSIFERLAFDKAARYDNKEPNHRYCLQPHLGALMSCCDGERHDLSQSSVKRHNIAFLFTSLSYIGCHLHCLRAAHLAFQAVPTFSLAACPDFHCNPSNIRHLQRISLTRDTLALGICLSYYNPKSIHLYTTRQPSKRQQTKQSCSIPFRLHVSRLGYRTLC